MNKSLYNVHSIKYVNKIVLLPVYTIYILLLTTRSLYLRPLKTQHDGGIRTWRGNTWSIIKLNIKTPLNNILAVLYDHNGRLFKLFQIRKYFFCIVILNIIITVVSYWWETASSVMYYADVSHHYQWCTMLM